MAGTVVITYLELARGRRRSGRPRARAARGFATRIVHDPASTPTCTGASAPTTRGSTACRWSDERWARWAERVETHLVELDGRAAGYFELELDSDESAKIADLRPAAGVPRARARRPRAHGGAEPRPRAAPARLADHVHARRPARAGELPGPRDAPVPHGHAAGARVARRPPAPAAAWHPLRPVNVRRDRTVPVLKSVVCRQNATRRARPSCPATSSTSPPRRPSARAPS